ncbi:tRNA 2-selenouridine/geranyl-2-thiouridine synthase [Bienertia sinuspersici]
MGVTQAVRVAMEAGFRAFILETDSVTLWIATKSGRKESSRFGLVVSNIGNMLSNCNDVSFS